MKGEIDTSFQTLQNDMFASGLAAKIGMNSFGVWAAIKNYADYATGECWPGMRRLAELTGLSVGSVQKGVQVLLNEKLLRIAGEGGGKRSNRYIARERLDIRVGKVMICTIVLDYVPARMKSRVNSIEASIKRGRMNGPAFAECEIIPGPGFIWDSESASLKAEIPFDKLPEPVDNAVDSLLITDSSVHFEQS